MRRWYHNKHILHYPQRKKIICFDYRLMTTGRIAHYFYKGVGNAVENDFMTSKQMLHYQGNALDDDIMTIEQILYQSSLN